MVLRYLYGVLVIVNRDNITDFLEKKSLRYYQEYQDCPDTNIERKNNYYYELLDLVRKLPYLFQLPYTEECNSHTSF